jgi:hypothetical protein
METDLSFQHLQAELTRIDRSLQRAVRRWRLAGQDPADAFRGLYLSEADVDALLERPLHTNWGQLTQLPPEEEEAYRQMAAQASADVKAIAAQAKATNQRLRLYELAQAFGLERFDLDVLLIVLAPALDLRYEKLYGYLQDDVTRKRPTINLALDLLCEADATRLMRLSHFKDDAPLFKYRLIERVADTSHAKLPLLSQSLVPDEAIVAWLLGNFQPHSDLGFHADLISPQKNVADELLAADALDDVKLDFQQNPLCVFYGPDHARQLAAARLLAAEASRELLLVDVAAVVKTGQTPLQVVRLALRDARLAGAWPLLVGWDACLVDNVPSAEILSEVCAHPETLIITGQVHWHPKDVERTRHFTWIECDLPDYAHREALWDHFLERGEEADDTFDLAALSSQFVLTASQIRDAVASARDLSVQRGTVLQEADLFVAARTHSSLGLMNLARKLNPRYDWSDIILPDDQRTILHELVSTVRGRSIVLEGWGVGQKLASSHGVTVLFAGPPGTGKTMAAEVIASELRLDLYKIELSGIVSKYIGETEKNLEKIFNEAESSNAILFFDEADAIFGKRSEVKDSHDRYANIEISYLLQRMEGYDGVTILATNLRANLDEAFTRRLQFAVDFPFPEEVDRLRIWEALFPPGVPRATNLDLRHMARQFKLAGGNIRNIIISAAYLAAADGGMVKMEHLLHGARRELQKMGRLLREKDMIVPREESNL